MRSAAAAVSQVTEMKMGGRQGYALCAAWLLHGICISLQSHPVWGTSSLDVEVTAISEDGELNTEHDAVRHVSRPEHFLDHEQWIPRPQKSSIQNGRDLIAQASSLFPAIEICEDAEAQILAMTGKERYFDWVLEGLAAGKRECLPGQMGPFHIGICQDQLPMKARA